MANNYVSVKHDSFKNKTTTQTYELEYNLAARRFKLTETAKFDIRHVSCEPDIDALVIDVHFKSVEANTSATSLKSAVRTYPGEWAFLRNGQLIIQINGLENIALDPYDCGSDVTTQNITDASACEELVYYEINREILEKICSANTLRMQLSGSAGSWTIEGGDMIFLAKAFYNGFYDETKYADELEHAQNVANAQSQIKKKGCLLEVISFIAGFILSVSLDDENIGILFMFIIPIAIGIIRRKKAKNVK